MLSVLEERIMAWRVNGNHYSVFAEFASGKIFTAQFKDEQDARDEANRLYKMGAVEIILDYNWYVRSHRRSKNIKTFRRATK